MTPKEKARELVEKYDLTLTYLESKSKAKRCALIAVDEITEVLENDENVYLLGDSSYIDFWNEVKQEIENL